MTGKDEPATAESTAQRLPDGGGAHTWRRHVELVAVLLVIFVHPVAMYVLELFAPPGSRDAFDPYAPHVMLSYIPFDVGMAVVLLLLLRASAGAVQPRPTPLLEWKRELLLGLALGFGLYFAVYVVGYVAFTFGVRGDDAAWRPLPRDPDARLAFTVAAIFSSMFEEVAFRAYLQARLQDWMPRARFLPVILAAAAFALSHGYAPLGSIGVYAFGLLTGFAYRKWRRLPRLVVAHWFFNAITVWR